MRLPVELPVAPMLAKSSPRVPDPGQVPGGYAYEPKWDGFRCLVLRDGDEVELASRGSKPLTRYFPEVREDVLAHLPERCIIDAEIICRSGAPGQQRLSWDTLSQRIHPAASRIARLAAETPAELVCFDVLALGDEDLTARAFRDRRAALERTLADARTGDPVHLTRLTDDPELARRWFETFEGAGLDGIVAKAWESPYAPGKRTMVKVKHSRTAEAVVVGYRVHKSGSGVGSLLLGLYDDQGRLRPVGGIAAFTMATRHALIDELAPLVQRDDSGAVVHAETDRSRFSGNKDVSFVPLRPERVVEIAFDQLENDRFRHAVTFLRWRPDREPQSCTLEQIERAPAYNLADVLVTA